MLHNMLQAELGVFFATLVKIPAFFFNFLAYGFVITKLFWPGMKGIRYELIVWGIVGHWGCWGVVGGGGGVVVVYSQNAGILVALVRFYLVSRGIHINGLVQYLQC